MIKINNTNLSLKTIANSGQCFRFIQKENSENEFFILFNNQFVFAKQIDKNTIIFDCSQKFFDSFLFKYFDLNTDYSIFSKICYKNDVFLRKCILYSDGLRILNQNPFETIISFIISQRKSVPAIRTSIERLAKKCNKKIVNKYGIFYKFPTAKDILDLNKTELKSCGLGYRLEYILEFCKKYIDGKYDLNGYYNLSDDELINNLLTIKGVGIKVASCIALFSYHRLSICPKDVWINRILESKYNGEIPVKYKKYAGIIQQYWFNYIVNNRIL